MEVIVGIVIITIIFLLIHPIRFFVGRGGEKREEFENNDNAEKKRSGLIREEEENYTFEGNRWSGEEVRVFRETMGEMVRKFEQIQKDMEMTIEEYRSIDGEILTGAKKKKEEMKNSEEGLNIPGLDSLKNDPVEEYYKPIEEGKRMKERFLGGSKEVAERVGIEYEIPRIVLPDMRIITSKDEYKWVDMKEGKERYEKEQEYYIRIRTIIPILEKMVGELYINANIVRNSAGKKTHSLLPRVERIEMEIKEQERKIKKSTEEGFQGGEMTKTCKRMYVYKGEDYKKWELRLRDIMNIVYKSEKLVQEAESDIKIAGRIMKNIREKGEKEREKIRRLRLGEPRFP